MTGAIENACVHCGKQLAEADPHQLAAYATWDVVDRSGPYCGAGCMELARRNIPAAWAERVS